MAKGDAKVPAKKTSQANVDAFLERARLTPAQIIPGQRGRLLFAMDATASREPLWDRACHIQAQMFEQTATLGGLDIQLAYYRGYG